MHIVIDILALIVLLFFILSGWHKGFLLSLLGIVRVVLAYGAAYFCGRYLGYWLGEVANRPRIVTIPVLAIFTFGIITFIFHVIMSNLREEHRHKEEKEDYKHPWYSSAAGSSINFMIGLFSLVFLFWLGDLFLVGVTGGPIPGTERSKFADFSRRTVYEGVNLAVSREGRESQAAAMAKVVSNPAQGMQHLENVISADSVQRIIRDETFAKDLISGDAARIEQNASLQNLFNDRETLEELKQLGILSGREKKSEIYEALSRFGSNEKIQESLERLQEKKLFTTGNITQLIRDPDFDTIIAEISR